MPATAMSTPPPRPPPCPLTRSSTHSSIHVRLSGTTTQRTARQSKIALGSRKAGKSTLVLLMLDVLFSLLFLLSFYFVPFAARQHPSSPITSSSPTDLHIGFIYSSSSRCFFSTGEGHPFLSFIDDPYSYFNTSQQATTRQHNPTDDRSRCNIKTSHKPQEHTLSKLNAWRINRMLLWRRMAAHSKQILLTLLISSPRMADSTWICLG